MTVYSTRNKLIVAIWTPRTPVQFLLYNCTAIHTYKHMGINSDFAETKKLVEATKLNGEIATTEYVHLQNSKMKKNKGTRGEDTNP